jgi:hypothetical protein
MEPFAGPKLKVKRAKRHISDLNAEIGAFLKRDPYRIVLENNAETRKLGWIVRITEELSDQIPLIVGDAIHNLRTALDLLACDLVRLNGGNIKKVDFPFASEGDSLNKRIKERKIHRAGPDIVQIIKCLKPYKGGDNALWAIHDLDITDKHQLILPVVFLGGIPDVKTTFQSEIAITFQDYFICPVHDGTQINVIAASPDMQVGEKLKARFDVTFGDIDIFKSQSIVPTLIQLAELVEGIIDRFERHVGSRGKCSPAPTL